jgi:hypothetical protein
MTGLDRKSLRGKLRRLGLAPQQKAAEDAAEDARAP